MSINKKVIIIAEVCQNHKGDLSILKDMIYAAKEAGANYIKIQSMLAKELTQRDQFEEGVRENGSTTTMKRPYQPEFDRLISMDLDDEAHVWFVEECTKAGIKPLTTVFSPSRITFLSSLHWDAVKVASYDCASYPLINSLKTCFQHLYISTGATFDSEIQHTADTLKDKSFSFLHCVLIYPTPLDQCHLNRIDWLRQFTPSVGFSDHSLVARDHLKASLGAIYYGADIIERHFTILGPEETKDGPISVNPTQLKELVNFCQLDKKEQGKFVNKYIPEYSIMLGSKERELTAIEQMNRDYYRGRFAMRKGEDLIYNWEKR